MKLEPKDLEIVTTCSECIFSLCEDNNQVGCQLNRIEKFKERKELKTKSNPGYYEINRFCNAFRSKDWLYTEDDDRVEKLKDELMPSFGIVIYDSTEENSLIEKAINSVMNLDYPSDKITAVVSSYNTKSVQNLINITQKLLDKYKGSRLLINFHNQRKDIIDYDAFSKIIDKSYFVKMDYNSEIDPSMLLDINKSLNEDLEKVIAYKQKNADGSPTVAFPKNIVRNYYLRYNDFDVMSRNLIKESQKINLFKYL